MARNKWAGGGPDFRTGAQSTPASLRRTDYLVLFLIIEKFIHSVPAGMHVHVWQDDCSCEDSKIRTMFLGFVTLTSWMSPPTFSSVLVLSGLWISKNECPLRYQTNLELGGSRSVGLIFKNQNLGLVLAVAEYRLYCWTGTLYWAAMSCHWPSTFNQTSVRRSWYSYRLPRDVPSSW